MNGHRSTIPSLYTSYELITLSPLWAFRLLTHTAFLSPHITEIEIKIVGTMNLSSPQQAWGGNPCVKIHCETSKYVILLRSETTVKLRVSRPNPENPENQSTRHILKWGGTST